MRSYRETRLSIGQEGVKLATAAAGEVLEKQIQVPDSWLRGFLQVQSAAALPSDRFRLNPIDLYNVLRHLRLHGDRKGKRRGLRIELVPGEPPRLVLEPWNEVIPATAGPYKGRASRVVRVWGRRRLMLIQRLLPFVEEVEVHLLGSGLPSFWVLRAAGHDADARADRLHRRQLVAGAQLRPAPAAQDADDERAARRRARLPARALVRRRRRARQGDGPRRGRR